MPPITLPRPDPGPPPAVRLPEVERRTLGNGLRLVTAPGGATGQSLLRIVLPCGAAADPEGRAGLAALTANLLREGTELRDGTTLNRDLDRLGASIRVRAGHDFTEIGLASLTETLDAALGIVAEMLRRPAFEADDLRRVRGEMVDELLAREDEPADRADDQMSREIFGEHPYGRRPEGTDEDLARIGRNDVTAFHERWMRPGGSLAVAAGDVDPDRLADLLAGALDGWNGAAPEPDRRTPNVPGAPGSNITVESGDAPQAEIRVGGQGMPRNAPDWPVAAVANYILGGSTITGRLGANLREEKGWTYGARSAFVGALLSGSWTVETAVAAEVADAAVREIHGELRRLIDTPVPPDELARARDAMVLSLPHAFATPARVLSRLTTVEAYGLPGDYWLRFTEAVQETTGRTVREMASRYFDPARLVTVVAGPGRA